MNIAAILSGGIGNRAEAGIPKQFVELGGRPMILRTVDAFERCDDIDEILVVSHPDFIEKLETMRREGNFKKWRRTIAGGKERYLSSYEAVKAFDGSNGNILIHDAARPFIQPELIHRLVKALENCEAAAPAIALSDTLVGVDGQRIKSAPLRENYRLVQTPQAFHLPVIRSAFEIALKDININATDDCGIILNYLPEIEIKYIEGDIFNKKLTYHSDIEIFNKLFLEKEENRLHN